MEDKYLDNLKQFLSQLPAGKVPEDQEKELITLLKHCWETLNPEGFEDLFTYKLDRIEDPHWEPPIITFRIERHGGTAMGSTRAEMQYWVINMDNLELDCRENGHRQLYRRQPKVNVDSIADELALFIVNRRSHKWLKWSAAGRVSVMSGEVFPDGSGFKETVSGRRKRLIMALEKRLNPVGWSRSGSWWDYKTYDEELAIP